MLSDYLAGELHKAAVGLGEPFQVAAPTFLALLGVQAVHTDTGTTLEAKEVSYGGYQRVAVPALAWDDPGEAQAIVNGEEIALPVWTSGGAQVIGWALCDAAHEGNLLFYGITAALRIDEADPEPVIGPGLLRHVFA